MASKNPGSRINNAETPRGADLQMDILAEAPRHVSSDSTTSALIADAQNFTGAGIAVVRLLALATSAESTHVDHEDIAASLWGAFHLLDWGKSSYDIAARLARVKP